MNQKKKKEKFRMQGKQDIFVRKISLLKQLKIVWENNNL